MRDRKKRLLNAIIDHLESGSHTPVVQNPSPTDAAAFIEETIEQRRYIDAQNGIRSQRIVVETANNPQQEVLLRVVNTQPTNLKAPVLRVQNLNYKRIFYGYMAAALSMGKMYDGVDEAQLKTKMIELKNKVDSYFKTRVTDQSTDNEILFQLSIYKRKLSKILRDAGLDHANKLEEKDKETDVLELIMRQLDQAKNWIALEKPTMAIATVIQAPAANQEKIIILDDPVTALTDEQKDLLNSVKTGNAGEWFHKLSPLQQRLLRYHLPSILAENRIIPSQLRALLPLGNKNAYDQSIYAVHTEAGKKRYWPLNDVLHSGTPAYLNAKVDKKEAIKLTRNNLQQLKNNCDTDALCFITLNSQSVDQVLKPYTQAKNFLFRQKEQYRPDDSTIIEYLYGAAKELHEENIFVAKVPLNGARLIERNELSGIQSIIQIIKQNITIIKKSAPHSAILQQMEAQLQQINSIRHPFPSLDKEVINLDLIKHLTLLSNLNNQLIAKHQNLYDRLKAEKARHRLQTTKIGFGCASGKNRTTILYHTLICESYIYYLEQKLGRALSKEERKKIIKTWTSFLHEKAVTGLQGTTPGGDGVRKKSKHTCKPEHNAKALIATTAETDIPTASLESLTTWVKQAFQKTSTVVTTNTKDLDFQKKMQHFINKAKDAKGLTVQQRSILLKVVNAIRQINVANNSSDVQKKKRAYERLKMHISTLQTEAVFKKTSRFSLLPDKSIFMLAEELRKHPALMQLSRSARVTRSNPR